MSRPTLDAWVAEKIGSEPPLTREALEAYQLKMLNRTLAHAAQHSRFYRARFGSVQLGCLSALSALPFTTPEDLIADPGGLLCVSPSEIERIVTLSTSGTTGAPKRVQFTGPDLALCTDFFHHGMRNLVDETDTVGILFPARTPASVGDQLKRGLGRLVAGAEPLFELSEPEQRTRIASGALTSLAGFPNQIARLAQELPGLTSIKTVLLSADYVSDAVRAAIQTAWGAEIFEHYGMTEMGLGCAVSCEYHTGYHVREADLYLEIIDSVTGRVLPDGQWGEIVFTTLTRTGMPFLRYRTGDHSRWMTHPCPCGSKLKLLDYVLSRAKPKGAGAFRAL